MGTRSDTSDTRVERLGAERSQVQILSPRSQAKSSDAFVILEETADLDQENGSIELAATLAIDKRIYVIRGRQVMFDEDLADLYLVETKRLIEQVKRNLERFPEDFMFQLRNDEAAVLRSRIATSNTGRGGRRYAPYVFAE